MTQKTETTPKYSQETEIEFRSITIKEPSNDWAKRTKGH